MIKEIKEIKDLSKNVRVSTEALNEIKAHGWSIQTALDHMIKRIRKKGIKPEIKKEDTR